MDEKAMAALLAIRAALPACGADNKAPAPKVVKKDEKLSDKELFLKYALR